MTDWKHISTYQQRLLTEVADLDIRQKLVEEFDAYNSMRRIHVNFVLAYANFLGVAGQEQAFAEWFRSRGTSDPPPRDTSVANLKCPECEQIIPVAIRTVEIGYNHDGEQVLTINPDLSEVWSHAWTHGDAA